MHPQRGGSRDLAGRKGVTGTFLALGMTDSEGLYEELKEWFADKRVAVAFSGGADSTIVALAAYDACIGQQLLDPLVDKRVAVNRIVDGLSADGRYQELLDVRSAGCMCAAAQDITQGYGMRGYALPNISVKHPFRGFDTIIIRDYKRNTRLPSPLP